jgi:CheY-like chemotaxis protein
MRRIVLIHWNPEEAELNARPLREANYDVSCYSDTRANPSSLREAPPDAYVIDLHRLPSQGREIGGWLRRQKPTRHVPLVFVKGDPDKTARVRTLLPDATYASWDGIVRAVGEAIAHPPPSPVVPGAMDAYRGVPLAQRLGIGDGTSVVALGSPDGVETVLAELQDETALVSREADRASVVLWFVISQDELAAGFTGVVSHVDMGGRLWIAWPKKASGVGSDLSQTVVRAFGLKRGLVDYKIVSIDKTWSGLCFARRPSKDPNGGLDSAQDTA